VKRSSIDFVLIKGKEDQVTVAPEKEITVIAKKGSKEPYKIGTELDKSIFIS
jgi:D-alanyl-D-alanine carboxypeptidase